MIRIFQTHLTGWFGYQPWFKPWKSKRLWLIFITVDVTLEISIRNTHKWYKSSWNRMPENPEKPRRRKIFLRILPGEKKSSPAGVQFAHLRSWPATGQHWLVGGTRNGHQWILRTDLPIDLTTRWRQNNFSSWLSGSILYNSNALRLCHRYRQ